MNFSVQIKKWPDRWRVNLIGFIYWLIGLPLALGLLFLLLSSQSIIDLSPYKAQQVTTWQQALPAQATYSQEYFKWLNSQELDVTEANWEQVALPNFVELGAKPSLTSHPPMARVWFKFTHQLPQTTIAGQTMALYGARAMGGPYTVWANGELIFSSLDDWRMLWNKPILVPIPQRMIQPGAQVEILFGLPHRVSLGYSMGTLYLGPQGDLQSSWNLRYVLQVGLPLVGMLMIGVTGLFSLGLWFKRRKESAHLWLFVLAASLIACNLQFTHDIAASQEASQWFGSLVDSATSWVFLTFFIFVQRYTGLNYQKTTLFLAVFTAANTLLTLPIWGWEVYGLLLQHYILLVIYISIVMLLTWIAVRRRGLENILLCAALWFMLAAGTCDLTLIASHKMPDLVYMFPYAAFVLFFVPESLQRRKYRLALTQIEANNETLEQKLKEREKEILHQQEILQQTREQVVLQAERMRLSRDIHDGIGSVLTGTLIHLRGEETSALQAAEQVQSCLEEIRLVIDSMEPTQADLSSLVSNLRRRFSNLFEAAGVRIHWQVQEIEGIELGHASATLNLVRVLQEIFTNILKHAHANDVNATVKRVNDTEGRNFLSIEIRDDGIGFDDRAAFAGRGMRNIQQRVKDLKGELQLTSELKSGTCYNLNIPIKMANPPA